MLRSIKGRGKHGSDQIQEEKNTFSTDTAESVMSSTTIFVIIMTFIVGFYICYIMHYIFDIYRSLPQDDSHLIEDIKYTIKKDVSADLKHLQDDINWLLDRTTKHDGKKKHT